VHLVFMVSLLVVFNVTADCKIDFCIRRINYNPFGHLTDLRENSKNLTRLVFEWQKNTVKFGLLP
jgi:hypothetical protein